MPEVQEGILIAAVAITEWSATLSKADMLGMFVTLLIGYTMGALKNVRTK